MWIRSEPLGTMATNIDTRLNMNYCTNVLDQQHLRAHANQMGAPGKLAVNT